LGGTSEDSTRCVKASGFPAQTIATDSKHAIGAMSNQGVQLSDGLNHYFDLI
jgi:hypothetical protein